MAPSRFSGAKHTPKDGSASPPEALPRARTLLAVLLFYALVAAAFTYPLVRFDRPLLPHADDSYFNVWRLAWVAHQLGRDPGALFDSNVFHPLRNTLAYSDAMLGLGVLAAPAIRLGLHPVVVHNLLVLLAFTTAAFAAFLLCRTLVASTAAALVGGLIVGFAPYRFAHIGHLELLWTAPMPLALLVLHRARTHPRSWRQGLLLGAIVAAQAYCSLYYAVFLALFIALWTLLALLLEQGDARGRLVRCVAAGGVAGLLLTAPYGYVYYTVHRELGGRDVHEIRTHSATPSDYVRVNAGNRLYRPDPATASEERSLFPGITASLLALCALIFARRRTTFLYAALTVLAFDLSLGTNGVGYPLVSAAAPLLSGLRAPARFATLVLVALAVLATIGLHAVVKDLAAVPRRLVAGTLAVLCLAEYWSAPIATRVPILTRPAVHQWLRGHSDSVVLHLPLPTPGTLWAYETHYQYMSIYHWNRLVNGYSGYAPRAYVATLGRLQSLPDAAAIARLRELGVEHVIVHERFYEPAEFVAVVTALMQSPEFDEPLTLPDPVDPAYVFTLRAQPSG